MCNYIMKECKTKLCWLNVLARWYCSKCYWSIKSKWLFWWSTCCVDWCIKIVYAKGYCSKHLTRIKRYWEYNYTKIVRWEDRSNNKLYNTYCWMKERCYNKNSNAFNNYWWRWITICDRWLWNDWFKNFLEDMWNRPEWYSLDRIDVNWNYELSNCRRATKKEQSNNTRRTLIFNWESASEAQKRLWLWRWVISWRIKRWWSLKDAFNTQFLQNDSSRKTNKIITR